MRIALRKTWHTLAIVSSIVALSLAFADIHGFDLRFSRHRQAWQFASNDGLLRLGNAPQIAIEAKQIQEARDERARDNDAREAETRNILREAPWRSPAYEAALIKLKELKDGEAALAAREESESAASRSQPIEHALSLRRLILVSGAFPVAWLITMFLAFWARLKRAGWRRREIIQMGTALCSALMILVLAGSWIRSKFARDEIRYEVRQPPALYEYWIVGSGDGDISCSYLKNKFMLNLIHQPQPHFPGSEQIYAPRTSKSWEFTHVSFPSQKPSGRRRFSFHSGFGASASSWSDWNRSRSIVPTLGTSMYFSVPIWLLMLPFMIACLMVMRLFRKRLRHIQGCCQKCGYNLRASPDRCPECGMVKVA